MTGIGILYHKGEYTCYCVIMITQYYCNITEMKSSHIILNTIVQPGPQCKKSIIA